MRLTEVAIRALPVPKRGQKTHLDDLTGFGVRVSSGGAKSYVLMYGRARNLMTIGRVGVITLADARQRARELLAEYTLGRTREVAHMSFGEAVERFTETHDIKESSRQKYRAIIQRHFKRLRLEPLERVRTADLMRTLDRLRDRPAEAAQTHKVLGVLFKWAVARRLIDRSPLEGIPRPYQGDPRDRVLTHHEIRCLFAEQSAPLAPIVQLILLTGQRPAQIAGLRREWIQGDLIRFPASIMKSGKSHQIPYGSMARAILDTRPASGLLFPNSKGEPFSSWPSEKKKLDRLTGVTGYTIHDCRRTFATLLAEVADPIVVEKFLAHSVILRGVAAIYNRHSYINEMRGAMQCYEEWLQTLLSNTGETNADLPRPHHERAHAAE